MVQYKTVQNNCVNCAYEMTCGYSMLATIGKRDEEFSFGPCVLGAKSGGEPFFEMKSDEANMVQD